MRFLSCDWGTSRMRLRLVATASGRVEAEVASDDGVARIQEAALQGVSSSGEAVESQLEEARARRFEATLARRIAELESQSTVCLENLPVVVSGMASSSIGWRELPYGTLPMTLDGRSLPTTRIALTGSGRHEVLLVSGLRAEADVLRGEEVEALGLLGPGPYRELAEDGLLILTGTHSKHIRVVDRQITTFETFMTGELYDVMARSSVLRSSVDPDALEGAWWESSPTLSKVFCGAVAESRGRALSSLLFSVRARQVLERRPPAWCAARLSGLLVGAELAGAASSVPDATPILIGASRSLETPYRLASTALGLERRTTFATEERMRAAVVFGQRLLLDLTSFDGSNRSPDP